MCTTTIDETRVEALFVSQVQRSEKLTPADVRAAVTRTISQHGYGGCAALVAQEFGEHPDTAVGRMQWALSVVQSAYARQ